MEKYNVYQIPSGYFYGGMSLIAAENAEHANQLIKEFKKSDPKNLESSCGYENITESYKLDNIYADKAGVLYKGIYRRD